MTRETSFHPDPVLKRNKSLIALITVITFTVTSIVWNPNGFASTGVSAAEVSASVAGTLQIPAELGRVSGLFKGDPSAPAFIHIQSAHGNYQAEKNIEKLLGYIEKNSSVKLMLLEGASGKLHPEMFRIFPEQPDFNHKVTDKLVAEGYLSGPENFLINQDEAYRKTDNAKRMTKAPSADFKAYGIEDLDAYKKDRDAFISVVKSDKNAQAFLRQLRAEVDKKFAGELNKDLLKIVRQEEAFGSGALSFEAWLKVLGEAGKKHLKQDLSDAFYQSEYPSLVRYYRLQAIGSGIDREKAMKESEDFLKELEKRNISKEILDLFRQGSGWRMEEGVKTKASSTFRLPMSGGDYSPLRRAFDNAFEKLPKDFSMDRWPNWALYSQHVILMQEIEGQGLQEEIVRLKDGIENALAKTPADKECLAAARQLYLLKRLFSLELTRAEYEELHNRMPEAGGRVTNNGVATSSVIRYPLSGEVASLYRSAMSFYETAVIREQKMFCNALIKMGETKQQRAVIVTGGFHAEGLKALARARNCSYLQITPRISEVSKRDHEVYLHSILGSRDFETSQMNALLGVVDRAQRVAVTGIDQAQAWFGGVRRSILERISVEPVSSRNGFSTSLDLSPDFGIPVFQTVPISSKALATVSSRAERRGKIEYFPKDPSHHRNHKMERFFGKDDRAGDVWKSYQSVADPVKTIMAEDARVLLYSGYADARSAARWFLGQVLGYEVQDLLEKRNDPAAVVALYKEYYETEHLKKRRILLDILFSAYQEVNRVQLQANAAAALDMIQNLDIIFENSEPGDAGKKKEAQQKLAAEVAPFLEGLNVVIPGTSVPVNVYEAFKRLNVEVLDHVYRVGESADSVVNVYRNAIVVLHPGFETMKPYEKAALLAGAAIQYAAREWVIRSNDVRWSDEIEYKIFEVSARKTAPIRLNMHEVLKKFYDPSIPAGKMNAREFESKKGLIKPGHVEWMEDVPEEYYWHAAKDAVSGIKAEFIYAAGKADRLFKSFVKIGIISKENEKDPVTVRKFRMWNLDVWEVIRLLKEHKTALEAEKRKQKTRLRILETDLGAEISRYLDLKMAQEDLENKIDDAKEEEELARLQAELKRVKEERKKFNRAKDSDPELSGDEYDRLTEEVEELGIYIAEAERPVPENARHLGLGVRHMLALVEGIRRQAVEYARHEGVDQTVTEALVRNALASKKVFISVNPNIKDDVARDFKENQFFGLDKENIVFVMNDDEPSGFEWRDAEKRFVFSYMRNDKSYNHGFNLIYASLPYMSYRWDDAERDFRIMAVPAFRYLLKKGGRSFAIHRVNDLTLLDPVSAAGSRPHAAYKYFRKTMKANSAHVVLQNFTGEKGGLEYGSEEIPEPFSALVEGDQLKSEDAQRLRRKLKQRVKAETGLQDDPYNKLYQIANAEELMDRMLDNADGLPELPMVIQVLAQRSGQAGDVIAPNTASGNATTIPGVRSIALMAKNDRLLDEGILYRETYYNPYEAYVAGQGDLIHDFKRAGHVTPLRQMAEYQDNRFQVKPSSKKVTQKIRAELRDSAVDRAERRLTEAQRNRRRTFDERDARLRAGSGDAANYKVGLPAEKLVGVPFSQFMDESDAERFLRFKETAGYRNARGNVEQAALLAVWKAFWATEKNIARLDPHVDALTTLLNSRAWADLSEDERALLEGFLVALPKYAKVNSDHAYEVWRDYIRSAGFKALGSGARQQDMKDFEGKLAAIFSHRRSREQVDFELNKLSRSLKKSAGSDRAELRKPMTVAERQVHLRGRLGLWYEVFLFGGPLFGVVSAVPLLFHQPHMLPFVVMAGGIKDFFLAAIFGSLFLAFMGAIAGALICDGFWRLFDPKSYKANQEVLEAERKRERAEREAQIAASDDDDGPSDSGYSGPGVGDYYALPLALAAGLMGASAFGDIVTGIKGPGQITAEVSLHGNYQVMTSPTLPATNWIAGEIQPATNAQTLHFSTAASGKQEFARVVFVPPALPNWWERLEVDPNFAVQSRDRYNGTDHYIKNLLTGQEIYLMSWTRGPSVPLGYIFNYYITPDGKTLIFDQVRAGTGLDPQIRIVDLVTGAATWIVDSRFAEASLNPVDLTLMPGYAIIRTSLSMFKKVNLSTREVLPIDEATRFDLAQRDFPAMSNFIHEYLFARGYVEASLGWVSGVAPYYIEPNYGWRPYSAFTSEFNGVALSGLESQGLLTGFAKAQLSQASMAFYTQRYLSVLGFQVNYQPWLDSFSATYAAPGVKTFTDFQNEFTPDQIRTLLNSSYISPRSERRSAMQDQDSSGIQAKQRTPEDTIVMGSVISGFVGFATGVVLGVYLMVTVPAFLRAETILLAFAMGVAAAVAFAAAANFMIPVFWRLLKPARYAEYVEEKKIARERESAINETTSSDDEGQFRPGEDGRSSSTHPLMNPFPLALMAGQNGAAGVASSLQTAWSEHQILMIAGFAVASAVVGGIAGWITSKVRERVRAAKLAGEERQLIAEQRRQNPILDSIMTEAPDISLSEALALVDKAQDMSKREGGFEVSRTFRVWTIDRPGSRALMARFAQPVRRQGYKVMDEIQQYADAERERASEANLNGADGDESSRAELRGRYIDQDDNRLPDDVRDREAREAYEALVDSLEPQVWDRIFVKNGIKRRVSAAQDLAQFVAMEDTYAIMRLTKALKDPSSEVRIAVVKALGTKASLALVGILGDTDSLVRIQAAGELLRLRDPRLTEMQRYFEWINDSKGNYNVLNGAEINTLRSCLIRGEQVQVSYVEVPQVYPTYESVGDGRGGGPFDGALISAGKAGELTVTLEGSRPMPQESAAEAPKDAGSRAPLRPARAQEDQLRRAMNDVEPKFYDGWFNHYGEDRRTAAAKKLGEIGDPRAVDVLARASTDRRVSIRYEALKALGAINDPKVIPVLVLAALNDNDRLAREIAVGILWSKKEFSGLFSALGNENDRGRKAAAAALAMTKDPSMGSADPSVGSALHSALDSEKAGDVWLAIAEALWEIGDTEIVGRLIPWLTDASLERRRKAATMFSRHAATQALPALLVALKDRSISDLVVTALEKYHTAASVAAVKAYRSMVASEEAERAAREAVASSGSDDDAAQVNEDMGADIQGPFGRMELRSVPEQQFQKALNDPSSFSSLQTLSEVLRVELQVKKEELMRIPPRRSGIVVSGGPGDRGRVYGTGEYETVLAHSLASKNDAYVKLAREIASMEKTREAILTLLKRNKTQRTENKLRAELWMDNEKLVIPQIAMPDLSSLSTKIRVAWGVAGSVVSPTLYASPDYRFRILPELFAGTVHYREVLPVPEALRKTRPETVRLIDRSWASSVERVVIDQRTKIPDVRDILPEVPLFRHDPKVTGYLVFVGVRDTDVLNFKLALAAAGATDVLDKNLKVVHFRNAADLLGWFNRVRDQKVVPMAFVTDGNVPELSEVSRIRAGKKSGVLRVKAGAGALGQTACVVGSAVKLLDDNFIELHKLDFASMDELGVTALLTEFTASLAGARRTAASA